MKLQPLFLVKVVGKNVKFINLTDSPVGTTYLWDFGDGSPTSTEHSPTHDYTEVGFYKVKLSVTHDIDTVTEGKTVAISEAKTALPGSIYQLIDRYLPTGIVAVMPFKQKELYIHKWQLYLQPLVNHEVPIEEYSNELFYEALENQLIMELAVYDFMVVTLTNLLQAKTQTETENSSSSQPGPNTQPNGNIKKISTGPTEVEFYDTSESSSNTMSSAIKAVQPGGILDVMRKNICMLAERLSIFLPICQKGYANVVPEVTNKGWHRPLKGPNPTYPLDK